MIARRVKATSGTVYKENRTQIIQFTLESLTFIYVGNSPGELISAAHSCRINETRFYLLFLNHLIKLHVRG